MKKLEKLTTEELSSHLKTLKEEQEQLHREYDAISKALGNKRSAINKIQEIIDSRTLTPTDYEKLLEVYPETKSKRKLRQEVLAQWGLDSSGYFTETEQIVVKIALYCRDDDMLHATYRGIKKILHVIKPLEDGYKAFKIFERTTGADGVYYLKIKDGKYKLIRIRYGREAEIFSSDNLLTTLKYIQQHHYYDGTVNRITKAYYKKMRKKYNQEEKQNT